MSVNLQVMLMKKQFTYNDVPEALSEILAKLGTVQTLIEQSSPQESKVEFLDTKEAAEFLGRAVSTVYRQAREGKIPHSKPDGKLLFKRSELLEYLSSGKRVTTEGRTAFLSNSVDDILHRAGKSRKIRR